MYLWLVCLLITFLFSRAHLLAININQQATDSVPPSLTCCSLLLARHACPCSTQTYANEVTLSAHTDGTTATCCHGCAITLYHPWPPPQKKKTMFPGSHEHTLESHYFRNSALERWAPSSAPPHKPGAATSGTGPLFLKTLEFDLLISNH